MPRDLPSFAVVLISAVWLVAALANAGLAWTAAFAFSLAFFARLWRLSEGKPFSRFPDAALFFVLFAAYLSTFRWHGGDDAPNSLLPFCLLRHGTLTLEPVLDPWFVGKLDNFTVLHLGKRLSIFPIAPAILALPVYVIPVLADVAINEQFLHHLSKISGALLTALSALALRRALLGRCSARWAMALGFLYGLGSWAFSVSSQALWQHSSAQLGVALGLWGLSGQGRGSDVLAGLGFGLAAASRPDNAFFLIAAGFYGLFWARGRLLGMLAGAAAPLGLLALYWVAYTGRLLPPEAEFQARIFADFQWQAFFGLIASPTRGLLWFFPAAFFGVVAAWRSRDARVKLMAAACAALWIFLCFYNAWVGGSTFGTRYFSVVALALTWAMAGLEADFKRAPRLARAWCAAAGVGVVVHFLGGYLSWPGSQQFDDQKAALWDLSLHPVAQLLAGEGALAALPMPARIAALAAAAACMFATARLFEKTLTTEKTQ